MTDTLHSLLVFAQEHGAEADEPSGIKLVLPDTAELLWGAVAFVIVACGLLVFEMLVISIQAYIFTLLTAFYIAESIHGHGDHADTSEHEAHKVETQRPLTEGIEAPATAA